MAVLRLSKKLIILSILTIFCVLYFFLPSIHLPSPSELDHPSYVLLPPGGQFMAEDTVPVATDYSKSIFPVQPTFLSSFFIPSSTLNNILSADAQHAKLLSTEVAENRSNSTVFSCVCGRVSDACVCCGSLSIPDEVCQKGFPSQFCGPLVLFSAAAESSTAHFCLNVTYLPKKQEVKTAGFLIPSSSSELMNGKDVQPRKFTQTLVIFDNQIFPVDSPSVFCVENSRTDPEIAICTQFSQLRYFYDTGSDHKTVFAGCAQVNMLLRRQFIVTNVPPFCFRAHRGAAGDVDQAAALAGEKVVQQAPNDKTQEKPVENSLKDSAVSTAVPLTQEQRKDQPKKVAGSLDAHDSLPVVP